MAEREVERCCDTCRKFGVLCDGDTASGYGCSVADGLQEWEPEEDEAEEVGT